jgi:hypothetical protein
VEEVKVGQQEPDHQGFQNTCQQTGVHDGNLGSREKTEDFQDNGGAGNDDVGFGLGQAGEAGPGSLGQGVQLVEYLSG